MNLRATCSIAALVLECLDTKTRGVFGVPLGTGSEVRANILMYASIRAGKSTFSALVRGVHWSLKKRFQFHRSRAVSKTASFTLETARVVYVADRQRLSRWV
jgi:hypothetical protein